MDMELKEETYRKFGYYPSDLKSGSHKPILVACDKCGKIRQNPKRSYFPFCKSCAPKSKPRPYKRSKHTEETKQKMSRAHEGLRKYSLLKNKNWLYDRYWVDELSMESIRKILGCSLNSVWYAMKKHSIPRRTLSEGHKGIRRSCSAETKKKIGDANRGRTFSIESRENMSVAQKGRQHSEETKEKMRLAQIGEKHHNWNGGKIERICQICGRVFYTAPSNIKYGRGKYCSRECYGSAQYKKIKRFCLECGKEIEVCPSKIKKGEGKFCSLTCFGKWRSENFKGINSPAWKDGASFEPYCHKFNNLFKEYIRNKFDRKCFLCDKTEEENKVKLSIHHVNYSKDCLCDDDISCQFIPLCISCHSKVHHDRDKWEMYFMNKLRNKLNGWYI